MKKGFAYILIVFFFTASAVSSLHIINEDGISIMAEQPQEEENNSEPKEAVSLLAVYNHNNECNYSMLQETKFSLFKHFPDNEDHTSPVEFPPEAI